MDLSNNIIEKSLVMLQRTLFSADTPSQMLESDFNLKVKKKVAYIYIYFSSGMYYCRRFPPVR